MACRNSRVDPKYDQGDRYIHIFRVLDTFVHPIVLAILPYPTLPIIITTPNPNPNPFLSLKLPPSVSLSLSICDIL